MSCTEVDCSPLINTLQVRKQKEHLAYENPDGKIIVIG